MLKKIKKLFNKQERPPSPKWTEKDLKELQEMEELLEEIKRLEHEQGRSFELQKSDLFCIFF